MWGYLKNTNKPIVLYGMGNGADLVLKKLGELGVKPTAVFASPGFVRGNSFHGYKVITYEEASELYPDMIVLMCFGSQRPEVMDFVKKISVRHEFYVPCIPVIGDGIFDKAFAGAHREELDAVYQRLCDKKSREVFECVIKYQISGKPEYLFECETPPSEAFDNILKLGDDEIFMDLGAYTGDTVKEFLSHVKGYNKIYAAEPDIKTFKKLEANTGHLKNILRINKIIHSEQTALPFGTKAGRNSKIAESGKIVEADTVVNILGGSPVTYIKMDVEGWEAEAIKGARDTILKYKPKMLISCYHRAEDIFCLPQIVLSIRDDYKVFMRHYPYLPAWDTQFYFI